MSFGCVAGERNGGKLLSEELCSRGRFVSAGRRTAAQDITRLANTRGRVTWQFMRTDHDDVTTMVVFRRRQ